MTPDAYTIIGTGLALAVLNVGLFAWLRGDVGKLTERLDRLADQVRQPGERTAKLEGLLEDLREAISGRRAA